MDIPQAALCMEKLGHPTRLEIVRALVRAGPDGLKVGEIQRHLGIPASTLSHHLLNLVSVGLVSQQRAGRVLRCRADYDLMADLVAVLTEECCADAANGAAEHRKTGS
jgi:DNA-binding transcriptional ArsR family regulator